MGGKTDDNTTADYYVLVKALMSGVEPNQVNPSGLQYYQGTVNGTDLGLTASESIRAYPNNFIFSEYWYAFSMGDRGNSSFYWTSSVTNGAGYGLYFGNSFVHPGSGTYSKANGGVVRCVVNS